MPKLIAKVTIVGGKDGDVAPGASFSVKTEKEAEHLVAIDAAEYPEASAAPPATEGNEGA